MSVINVVTSDTFEQWRVKTNNISTVVGDGAALTTTATNVVSAINELRSGTIVGDITTTSGVFRVQIDSGDTYELTLNADGDLVVSGTVTGTRFYGPVTGNVTGNVTGDVTGNITGNAGTATKLATSRSISITGDATWTTTYDGSASSTGALTLSASGVTAGTYTKLTVDAKGRATAGTSLSSSDVTTALGFTPLTNNGKAVDSALLNGYTQTSGATANTIMWRDGSANVAVNVLYGRATSAQYADLAEKYTTDKEYAPGTVVVIAEGGDSECTQSWMSGQYALGVVSTAPAYLMNSEAPGQAIALKGRVPVRVVGPIRKGQKIMSTPDGCAQAGNDNVIGQALETNLNAGEKLVECAII